jgi:hypothetical protein
VGGGLVGNLTINEAKLYLSFLRHYLWRQENCGKILRIVTWRQNEQQNVSQHKLFTADFIAQLFKKEIADEFFDVWS